MGFIANIFGWMKKHPILTTILVIIVALLIYFLSVGGIVILIIILKNINANIQKKRLADDKSIKDLFNAIREKEWVTKEKEVTITDVDKERIKEVYEISINMDKYRKAAQKVFKGPVRKKMKTLQSQYESKKADYFNYPLSPTIIKQSGVDTVHYVAYGLAIIDRKILDHLLKMADIVQVFMPMKMYKKVIIETLLGHIKKTKPLAIRVEKQPIDMEYVESKTQMLKKILPAYGPNTSSIPLNNWNILKKKLNKIIIKNKGEVQEKAKDINLEEISPILALMPPPPDEDVTMEEIIEIAEEEES